MGWHGQLPTVLPIPLCQALQTVPVAPTVPTSNNAPASGRIFIFTSYQVYFRI